MATIEKKGNGWGRKIIINFSETWGCVGHQEERLESKSLVQRAEEGLKTKGGCNFQRNRRGEATSAKTDAPQLAKGF